MSEVNFTGGRSNAIKALYEHAAGICKVKTKSTYLEWELETAKPTAQRIAEIAKEKSEFDGLILQKTKSPELGQTLDILANSDDENLPSVHKDLYRFWQKAYDEAVSVPQSFVEEFSKLKTFANGIWATARKNNDFASFESHLTKIFENSRKQAEYINPNAKPYDVLLNTGENYTGFNADDLDTLFAKQEEAIKPLLPEIIAKNTAKPEIANKIIDISNLNEFKKIVMEAMGLDLSRTKLGITEHSFMIGFDSPHNIGIAIATPSTSKVTVSQCLKNIYSMIHETGHGLVEQNANEELYNTGLVGFTLGLHESQSRMWENNIGHSRSFWEHFYPKLQEKVEGFRNIDFEDFMGVVNNVTPSPIRINADEVTYNSHIMLRHQIEKHILNSTQSIAKSVHNLPEIWNAGMQRHLGITPKNDTEGCLQDVHWSSGLIGYFPTYGIGNFSAAQIARATRFRMSYFDQNIASGNLKKVKEVLRESMYQHGQIDTPQAIIFETTGEELNPGHYFDYIKYKYLDKK